MSNFDKIIHKGKTIIYVDFSNLKKVDEIYMVVDEVKPIIRSNPKFSALILTNFENMHFNNDVFKKFSEYAKGNKEYVKASAVIGLSGLIKVMYSGFSKVTNRSYKVCDTKTEALDYLASL